MPAYQGLEEHINVACAPETKAALVRAARERGTSLSELVRGAYDDLLVPGLVSVRLSTRDYKALSRLARSQGMTASALVREAISIVLEDAEPAEVERSSNPFIERARRAA
jgi:predicted HicB family RNase H-like nuclease